MKWLNAALFFVLLPISVFAEEKQYKSVLALDFENDLGFTDRYYTNGVRLSYTDNGSDWLANKLQFKLLELFIDENSKTQKFQTAGFGQGMYVGYDISDPNPPADDRPYCGLLYFFATSHIMRENSLDSFGLNIGLTGKYSFAEATQKFVHSINTEAKWPMGWHNQIETEPAFLFNYRHAERVYKIQKGSFGGDVVASCSANLGNIKVSGQADILLRFGYNLPNSFDAGCIDYSNSQNVGIAKANGANWHAYIFAAATGQVVGYDITLDGNAFRHSPRSVEKEYVVGTARFGASLRYDYIQLDYTFMIQSDEFENQKGSLRCYSYASLKILF